MKNKLIALFTVVLMLFQIVAPVMAIEVQDDKVETKLTPTYTPSSSYMGSKYYTQLCNVSLTGNQRTDIIAVAQSQYGYHEGGSINDLGGGSSSSGNYTEYGSWYGINPGAWCAMFVSWCARQAQIPTSVLKNSAVARCSASYFNIPYYNGSSYTPQPGDLFFTKSWSHVGIVASVSGSSFTTIEGNSSDKVTSHTYSISNYYFGVPSYTASPEEPPTYATISTDKFAYDVDETVTFTMSTDGNVNVLWIYCPNGDSLYYEDVGSSYQLGFGMQGHFKALVQTWNGYGSLCSEEIDFVIGPPTYATISTDEFAYDVDETVTFTMSTDGNVNVLWIYCPNGDVLSYADVGSSYQLGFGMQGHFKALVQTWNGYGSLCSEEIDFVVGSPTDAWVSVSSSDIKLGESITITFGSNDATSCVLEFERNGERIDTIDVTGLSSYTYTPGQTGNWSVYGTFTNTVGCTSSSLVYFNVINAVNTYTVTYLDGITGEIISTATVEHGTDAVFPTPPEHEGYTFTGWDSDGKNITSDTVITALYEENTSAILGDANGDGVINGKDVTLIRRYITGGYDVEVILEAADINGDGMINGKDITLLRRLIVGGYGDVA